MKTRKLAIIGFDSISLWFLERFVQRGVMPRVKELLDTGSVTQTWPCYPWETGTNWACLATGASPAVHGVNMGTHLAGAPLDQNVSGFDPHLLRAEPLWATAHRMGKRSVVIDWGQSWPLPFTDGIIHIGEDGSPSFSKRALQNPAGYSTDATPQSWWDHQVVRRITILPDGSFELPIIPGYMSRYKTVKPLYGRAFSDRVEIRASQEASEPLLTCRLNQMTDWRLHTFEADGQPVVAPLRAKLLRLSPDGRHLMLHLSQIYCQDDFLHPFSLSAELIAKCGPFVREPGSQQVVTYGGEDVPTFIEEQQYFSQWYARAAGHLLETQPWDLFMVKWHTPDWAQHLTFYMIDERHPLHDPSRAKEGWALWDKIMAWGDELVGAVQRAAGPDTLIALVSDHGGECELPGLHKHNDLNRLLADKGWLVRNAAGEIDWSRTVAFGREHYIYLNRRGRDPQGIVADGAEFYRLREAIIEAFLDWKDETGQHRFRVVLPMEEAGRLGIGGDRVGDIFLESARPSPTATVDKEKFWRTHTAAEVGTWDWPLINAGTHSDDSYFILAGSGVRHGYRRARPTLITSVAPTVATAWGIPVPRDADGSVLWDFLT